MISIVIPCFNEERNIKILYKSLIIVLKKISEPYEIIFVDDCSKDSTVNEIKEVIISNNFVKLIKLTKNFGHQSAIKAGIDNCNGDCCIVLDADLQHPPEHIADFVKIWKKNDYKVIQGIKTNNKASLFRKFLAFAGYRLINFFSSTNLDINGSDFYLLDKDVINDLKKISTKNLMFRSYINFMGYKKYKYLYQPRKRQFGTSNYSFFQLSEILRQSIISNSTKPLNYITLGGLVFLFLSIFMIILEIIRFIFIADRPGGIPTLIILISLFGGLNLFSIGVVGQYVGYLIKESNNYPSYIIEERIGFK